MLTLDIRDLSVYETVYDFEHPVIRDRRNNIIDIFYVNFS